MLTTKPPPCWRSRVEHDFSGKKGLLVRSDEVASSSPPEKSCGTREVCEANLQPQSPFFCLLFFGEAKKSKCPVGTRRMVKAKRMLTTRHKPFSGCLKRQPQCTHPKRGVRRNARSGKNSFGVATPYLPPAHKLLLTTNLR